MNGTEFLTALYGEHPPGHLIVWEAKNKSTSAVPADGGLEAAVETSMKLASNANVYFGVGLQASPPQTGRGKASGVCAIPGLWMDIDVQGAAHKATDLPPDVDSAMELVNSFPVRPSIIVDSGHGLHVWWVFDELWVFEREHDRTRAEILSRRFQATVGVLAGERGWKTDSTHDLARVLRLPGTTNRKDLCPPAVVRVLEHHPERRYRPEDFEPHLSKESEQAPRAEPIGERIGAGNRDAALTSLAGTMRRRGMGEPAILAALLEENRTKCDPPLTAFEVRKIARSVAGYRAGDSRSTDLHYTDTGNARRLAALHGHEIRYVGQWGCWLCWDGVRWQRDLKNTVTEMAKDVAAQLWQEVSAASNTDERKPIITAATQAESASGVRNMLALTQSIPNIAVNPDDVDRDPWLLNVANGIVDLRTGKLRDADPADLITKLAPVEFDSQAHLEMSTPFGPTVMA